MVQLNKTDLLLTCPFCKGNLDINHNDIRCTNCTQIYDIKNNIPRFFISNEPGKLKNDVTEKIKSFYEENPFPNYDDFDDTGSLIAKARKGIFAKLLDDQIPFGSKVLEVGCGTGQLTNFLSISNRTVIGTDMCINSLKLGMEFKEKNGLKRAHFIQMNLFRPCFKPGSFDMVICNGVLHHTGDPYGGFKAISSLVKPGGYILIGLYHRYGRLFTDLRRILFKVSKNRFKKLDTHASDQTVSKAKRNAWFMDQYKNPHESKHTFTEVKKWFEETGFTFVKSIPKTTLSDNFSESENLFRQDNFGGFYERIATNTKMVFTGAREGGFFIMIGKKSSS